MTDQRMRRGESRVQGPVRNRVRANGIEISYLEWTGRDASDWPPVLLLHGVLQTGAGMANLAVHLARQSRVIAPDMRGRGETTSEDGPFDPDTLADDMAVLMRTVGFDNAVVIGRMHGGVVAYHLAARFPELVSGLVLGDTPPEIDEARAAQSLRVVRELPSSFPSVDEALTYYQDVLQLSEGRARHDIPLDLAQSDDGSLRWRHNLRIIEQIEAAASPRSDWQLLKGIACPTLMIRGQRGAVSPDMSERICREISQASCRVQTVIGARHDVFLGPGCEQAFGAIDLMLMGLANRRMDERVPRPKEGQTEAEERGQAMVNRLVRVIQSGDADAISTIFAPDCHFVQYGEGGKMREGGIDAVQSAFSQLFVRQMGWEIIVGDVVASDDRLACVFAVHYPEGGRAIASFSPVFFRLRDHLIVDAEAYQLTIPAGDR